MTKPLRSRVGISVPATSANLGPGFDSFGLALDIRDAYVAEVVETPGVAVESSGVDSEDLPRDDSHLVARSMLLGCERLQLEYMSPHFFLAAVARASLQNPGFGERVRIVFAGEVFREVGDWAAQLGLADKVEQVGPVAPARAVELIRGADALLLTLYGTRACGYNWCVPSKTYSYLATGKPILGLVGEGETRDIVRRAGTGMIVEPDDIEGIAGALLRIFEEQEGGRAAATADWDFIRQFAGPVQQGLLVDFVSRVAGWGQAESCSEAVCST